MTVRKSRARADLIVAMDAMRRAIEGRNPNYPFLTLRESGTMLEVEKAIAALRREAASSRSGMAA